MTIEQLINDINTIHDLNRIMSFPTPDKAKEWIYNHYEILQNTINKCDDRMPLNLTYKKSIGVGGFTLCIWQMPLWPRQWPELCMYYQQELQQFL